MGRGRLAKGVGVQTDLRVLIVEDVEAEAELAVRQLHADGLRFTHLVVAGEIAMREALRTFTPDVILSDFTLPGFDGLGALEIAQIEVPDVPFIFLSGTIGEERAIDALKRGATDYVLKTRPARLGASIRRAMREVEERERRRLAELRIRESEQRLRDIIDTSQDWIWELDVNGRFVFSSESIRDVLGRSPEEISQLQFQQLIHPDDRTAFAGALATLDVERHTAVGVTARWMHSDQSPRWLEGNLLALFSAEGRVVGFRGTSRNITERRQQQERIDRLTRVLQMQSGINSAVVRIRHRDELLREACRLAQTVGGYEFAMVSLVDPDKQHARPWHYTGSRGDLLVPKQFVIGDGTEADTSLTGLALRTGEIAISSNLDQSEPPVANRAQLLAAGFRSLVALPLIVDGARIGVLSLASRSADLLSTDEIRLLQEVTANLSFALQYRQKEDTVQFLAYFDALTGLAKRSLFCERLEHLLRRSSDIAGKPLVVAFDVEQLSRVNDSHGRMIGDLLLQRVAERLKFHFEDDDRIGYLGNGAFVVMLNAQKTSGDSVTSLLHNTLFRDAFNIDGHTMRVTCRSGVARFQIDGEDGGTLVQKAEAAMKQAKEAGEQSLNYSVKMHSEVSERLALEHRLRNAIDERQFVLHYQPQVSISTGRIEGLEALLRWNDPDHGIVSPAKFLPLLETSGLIVPVGEWVMRQAADDSRRSREAGFGPLRISVNVSALQVRRRNFVEQALSVLRDTFVDGGGVDLELTESSLLQDLDGTARKLRELRAQGVRVAIDDFGTGYSSLGLLSSLPVDILKIDRSFISGLPADRGSMTLVSSIIGLAQAFNLTVVAEGVETQQQLDTLRGMQCDLSQGYLHCRPLPLAEIEAHLAAAGASRSSGAS